MKQVCKNCGTTSTPFWRKDKADGKPLCNACGLYASKNDAPRPKVRFSPCLSAFPCLCFSPVNASFLSSTHHAFDVHQRNLLISVPQPAASSPPQHPCAAIHTGRCEAPPALGCAAFDFPRVAIQRPLCLLQLCLLTHCARGPLPTPHRCCGRVRRRVTCCGVGPWGTTMGTTQVPC